MCRSRVKSVTPTDGYSTYSVIRQSDFQELNKTSEPASKTRRMSRRNIQRQIAENVATYSRGESHLLHILFKK